MRNPSTYVLLGLVWLGLCTSASVGQESEEGIDFRVDIFTRQEGGYHTYRIPTMVVTSKGTVLLFCEGRKNSRRDSGDIDMLLIRSEDGGRTWGEKMVLLDEGTGRVGNSCAIIEKDTDVVHLLFTRGGGECLFYTKSTDEGKTWSKFVTTSDKPEQKEYTEDNFLKGFGGSEVGVGTGPVHGIQTKSGRLVAPSYCGRKIDGEGRGGSCVIYSDDLGKTWKAGGIIPFVDEIRHGECTIVERSDGSLLMNMRTGAPGLYALGHRALSTSTDGGLTWTKPVLDMNLPEPACQASMIRLSKDAILFLNPAVHHKGGFNLWARRNLTLRMSLDDGKTWPHTRVLSKALAGYSDMAVTKEGKILCVFENGKGDYCEKMSIVQVDPEWLAKGEPAKQEPPAEKKK